MKFKMGVGRTPNFQYLNRYNSAEHSLISLKFRIEYDSVTADTLRLFNIKG